MLKTLLVQMLTSEKVKTLIFKIVNLSTITAR